MNNSYRKFTTYKDIEDIKRLDFVVNSIKSLNNPQAKILDIGCGNGNISLALGSEGYEVLGIDIDRHSIEEATKLNEFSNVRFDLLDANSFNLQEKFDAVVCSEVLEHLKKPEELIGSIYPILKNQGILIATVPNGFGPREIFITKPMQWFHRKKLDGFLIKLKRIMRYSNHTRQSSNPDLTHIQFFSATVFQKLIEQSGFKLISWDNADFIERIFPYSWITKRIILLQKIDCTIADLLPRKFSSGFYTLWKKKI